MAAAAILINPKSRYLGNDLTDRHEIWHIVSYRIVHNKIIVFCLVISAYYGDLFHDRTLVCHCRCAIFLLGFFSWFLVLIYMSETNQCSWNHGYAYPMTYRCVCIFVFVFVTKMKPFLTLRARFYVAYSTIYTGTFHPRWE